MRPQNTTGITGLVAMECNSANCLMVFVHGALWAVYIPHVPCYAIWLGPSWHKKQKMSYDFLTFSLPSPAYPPYLSAGLNEKAVTRINSMPTMRSRPRQLSENHREQTVSRPQSLSTSHMTLEVGSMVEVESNSGITVYGVVRWLGTPGGKTGEWAGIELVSD